MYSTCDSYMDLNNNVHVNLILQHVELWQNYNMTLPQCNTDARMEMHSIPM